MTGGTLTVVGTSFVPGYYQYGGTLDGAADLTATSGFYWVTGTMSGTGKTIVGSAVTTGTIHTSDYGVAEPVLTRTLQNNGTIRHEGGYFNWYDNSTTI